MNKFTDTIKSLFQIKVLLTHLFLSIWIGYFIYFWLNALYIDTAGDLYVSHVTIWGDWAAHFTMGSAMAYRELFLESSPFLIGAPFSYPFIANLFSAVLIRSGLDFFLSFIIPSALCSLLLFLILFRFYQVIFKSRGTAIIASILFLCNGGLGFIQFFKDIATSPESWVTFFNPPTEYTHLADWHLEWISVIYSMIIPQRAFSFGFPLALAILLILYHIFFTTKKITPRQYYVAMISGILTGCLVLIHTHSFLALSVIIPFWGIASLIRSTNKKQLMSLWIVWLTMVLSIGLPLYLNFLAENVAGNFFSVYLGWFAQEKNINWLWFWFLNWGIVPILALIGYWLYVVKAKSREELIKKVLLFLPFFVLFALINIFLFQPYIWDNTKLLVWASVGISGLAGYCLYNGLIFTKAEWTSQKAKRIILILVSSFLFLVSSLSGAIDAWRILRFDLHRFQMYSHEELELAEWVKTNTDPDSIWLTGDRHNNWLYNLTGRQSLLTFRGWLWTHGYDYREVESDVSLAFTQLNNKAYLEKYNVNYVLIGDDEIIQWKARKTYFDQQYTIVKETKQYTIYAVR